MADQQHKTNSAKIAQLCYYDEVTDSWIPISSTNPIPIKIVDGSGNQVIPANPTDVQLVGGLVNEWDTVPTPIHINKRGVLDSSDFDVQHTLNHILKELKKINVHLEFITDEPVSIEDIGEG